MRDQDRRFHEEWLGLAQPVEGLVFSVPVLGDAQIAPKVRPSITAELEEHLDKDEDGAALRDVRAFFESFLGYDRPGMLVDRADLPEDLHFYAPEGRQDIRPSFAIARGPFDTADDDPFAEFDASATEESKDSASDDASPYVALVWDLTTDATDATSVSLDKPETETGTWRYPPTAKLERLLRHTGVPIGFVTNRRELRLVYAPPGESTAHLTFRFAQLAQRAGRPLVAALELLFDAKRTYGAAPEFTFEGLLAESRRRQADVTKDLAAQVFEAVEILLEGFEHAGARDCVGDRPDWLRAAQEAPDDHLYQGILSVVLRLVFILYSEDQSLVPVQHPTYAKHLSVLDLYERLAEDMGAHPESMHLRYGAYGRLVALFRAIYLGVSHEDLRLPPRRGKLFDPSAFPFLEGGLPDWTAAIALPEQRAAVQLPSIDDETVYRVLHRLVVFEGQRLSYRSLDVEQIGAVYESLMGYHVVRVESPAVRLGKNRVWVESEAVRAMKPSDRKRFWKDVCALSKTARTKADKAVKDADDATATVEALAELAPGRQAERARHRAAAGRLVLQPGEERRRTGSHYTPRWLSENVVRRTLKPVLACLGEERTAEQILELKICDPAMGSGAFLVAACRLLAEEVVAAWERSGRLAALTEEHGDASLHARRLVAQRCLYGVDKNAAAVELAKLSLWLVTLSKALPFTFVDHALRHGDSLVGLDLEQIKGFHWEGKDQLDTCRRALQDALEQALEHRAEIIALADREDASSQAEKQRLLEYAEQATASIRTVADACVGAFFAVSNAKSRERERAQRLDHVRLMFEGDQASRETLEGMAAETRARLAPFHWHIEFPEIFYQERPDPLDSGLVNGAALMDVFVGNPPFMSGSRISSRLGNGYRDWLLAIHHASHGNSDLVAHFLRRSRQLLGEHGVQGFIATNTVAQGDTRTTGLQHLVSEGAAIYSASTNTVWPGAAAVIVAQLHIAHGRLVDVLPKYRVLDGERVNCINSRLEPRAERPDPVALASNAGLCSKGVDTGGAGFVLDASQRSRLLDLEPRARERIRSYIGGQEVNSSPTQSPDRFVIDMQGLTLEEAARYPECLRWVENNVRPARMKLRSTAINDKLKTRWWLYWADRREFYRELRTRPRCLVTTVYTKHLCFSFQPSDRVCNSKLCLFQFERDAQFAVLQSRVHTSWAWRLGSTLKTDLNYSATTCFDTFPFPSQDPRKVSEPLENAGQRVYDTRAQYMVDADVGLTKAYNALKDPTNDEPRVLELRRLHEEMDRAVLGAYGWSDIEVAPFCPKTDADRAAVQRFEDEVIDRLYVLNAERAQEEERLGLRGKKGNKAKKTVSRRKRTASPDQPEFDLGE